MSATKFIVLRRHPGEDASFRIGGLNGRWVSRPALCAGVNGWQISDARATPTGEYERRKDGELAEVYWVRSIGPIEESEEALEGRERRTAPARSAQS